MKTVGENIRHIRKRKGLTQKELGEKLGISQAAIGQFEKSTRPPKVETISKIAFALDASIYDLTQDTSGWVGFSDEDFQNLKKFMNEDGKSIFQLKVNNLVEPFSKLNDLGQEKAIEQVEILTKIPEYRKEDTTD